LLPCGNIYASNGTSYFALAYRKNYGFATVGIPARPESDFNTPPKTKQARATQACYQLY